MWSFDDKTIQILKKYGIGGLGIATAAALKHYQTQPVNGDPYQAQPYSHLLLAGKGLSL